MSAPASTKCWRMPSAASLTWRWCGRLTGLAVSAGPLETVENIHKCRVELYLMRERIDTTTDTGKLLFTIVASIAEFERATIQKRAAAGMDRVRTALLEKGMFTARKSGKVRTRLGRPGAKPDQLDRARAHLAAGMAIGKTAKATGLGVGTVHRLKREMASAQA